MTSEASLSMSPQASEVLTILNHLLEIRRSNNRRPLLVTKVELEAALPYTYSKARPVERAVCGRFNNLRKHDKQHILLYSRI